MKNINFLIYLFSLFIFYSNLFGSDSKLIVQTLAPITSVGNNLNHITNPNDIYTLPGISSVGGKMLCPETFNPIEIYDGKGQSLSEVEKDWDIILSDFFIKPHLKRTAELCVSVATELGLSQTAVDLIRRSTKFHDIGGINYDIKKSGILSVNAQTMIRGYGFPIKKSKIEMNIFLQDYLKSNPDVPKELIIPGEDNFYVSMANIIAYLYFKETGKQLSKEEVYMLYAEFSHELNSIDILKNMNISLSEAEIFIIAYHFKAYTGDISVMKNIAENAGITLNEFVLLNQIIYVCDVVENGNNKQRRRDFRHKDYPEPLNETYQFLSRDKDSLPFKTLLKLIIEDRRDARNILCNGRESNEIPEDEIQFAKDTLLNTVNISQFKFYQTAS
ncbi:MAG: hypothetical protein ACD_79C00679G0006 [uncultured bacterium]|nr:MAG: hypothetical protein ACD_79C00679G0006 [uncultured bacterium]